MSRWMKYDLAKQTQLLKGWMKRCWDKSRRLEITDSEFGKSQLWPDRVEENISSARPDLWRLSLAVTSGPAKWVKYGRRWRGAGGGEFKSENRQVNILVLHLQTFVFKPPDEKIGKAA